MQKTRSVGRCLSLTLGLLGVGCSGKVVVHNEPPAAACNNNALDAGETCDGNQIGAATCAGLGFGSGALACNSTCSGFDTSGCNPCGNGVGDLGEACDDGNTDDCAGDCRADCSALVAVVGCGDGLLCGLEVCDDGDTSDCTGGCRADCTGPITVTGCGDGVVCNSEVCDDGNTAGGDYCSTNCMVITGACGDTITQNNEACDDGNTDDCAGACRGDCSAAVNVTGCGDGVVCNFEVCDDGNTAGGDYCSTDCMAITGVCGDNITQSNEVCDDGNTSDCDGLCRGDCSATVSVSGCGDGVACGGEACDSGGVNTAGCDADCSRPSCGDSYANDAASEDCDSGGIDTVACDSDCTAVSCGDGHFNTASEACDAGVIDTLICDSDCTLPGCGDSHTNLAAGESCDDAGIDTQTCDADCSAAACGDNYTNVAASEACDDGNTSDCSGGCRGDCSATVNLTGCGDGVTCGFEVCDDGNTNNCAGACRGDCSAPVSLSGCGDGVVCGVEACDDGNTNPGDYCAADCSAVTGFCGDGALQTGEACDDGNTADCVGACRGDCGALVGGCGDGAVCGVEACDDGNTSDCVGACRGDCSGPVTLNVCGDGVVCGVEACDDGNTSDCVGACRGDCSGPTTLSGCGDGAICGGELCDGAAPHGHTCATLGMGFTGGTLGACNGSCNGFVTSGCTRCGNNVIDSGEACDGQALGGQTCTTLGHDGGTLACNGVCTAYNEAGCFDCPVTCPPGAVCSQDTGGLCVCPVYLTACGGACISTRSDPNNCGACGKVCNVGAGEVCSAGACRTSCNAPLIGCQGQCIDTLNANQHCGGCPGVDCTATSRVCVDGVCATPAATLVTPAQCAGGGPPINLNMGCGANIVPGPVSCTGDLAAVSFRWALCSCNDIGGSNAINQDMFTDGFNSSLGPYDPRCEDNLTLCAPDNPATAPPWQSVQCSSVGDRDGDGLNTCAGEVGAGIGANSIFQNSATTVAWGSLWWRSPGPTPSIGSLSCEQELHIGGVLPGAVRGRDDAYVSGNVTANGSITGTLFQSPGATVSGVFTYGARDTSATFVIPAPCDCAQSKLVDVKGLVDCHRCTGAGAGAQKCQGNAAVNDNSLVGLSPDLFNNAGGRVDLPCGQYYLSSISSGADVTIVAHGRTVLYIGGDVNMGASASLNLFLTDSAELDVFVKGGMCINGAARIGSAAYPRRTRIYLSGGDPCAGRNQASCGTIATCTWNGSACVSTGSGVVACAGNPDRVPKALDLKNFTAAANVYAPWGTVYMPQDLLMYGGLLVAGYGVTQQTAIHFDTSVVDAGDTCPSSRCGDGVLNPGEQCDGTALGGRSCASIGFGFTGGVLACHPDCTYNTSACFTCGNLVKEPGEQCDGNDLGTPRIDCEDLGYTLGDIVACRPDCTANTSPCGFGASCGNTVRDGAEECDANDFGTPARTCVDEGFACGTITACRADCTVNTSGCQRCGDGVRNCSELCDGGDLGSATCVTLLLPPGTLACRPTCDGYDTSGCGNCLDCRDCGNQACISNQCGACTDSSQCCAPLECVSGTCTLCEDRDGDESTDASCGGSDCVDTWAQYCALYGSLRRCSDTGKSCATALDCTPPATCALVYATCPPATPLLYYKPLDIGPGIAGDTVDGTLCGDGIDNNCDGIDAPCQ